MTSDAPSSPRRIRRLGQHAYRPDPPSLAVRSPITSPGLHHLGPSRTASRGERFPRVSTVVGGSGAVPTAHIDDIDIIPSYTDCVKYIEWMDWGLVLGGPPHGPRRLGVNQRAEPPSLLQAHGNGAGFVALTPRWPGQGPARPVNGISGPAHDVPARPHARRPDRTGRVQPRFNRQHLQYPHRAYGTNKGDSAIAKQGVDAPPCTPIRGATTLSRAAVRVQPGATLDTGAAEPWCAVQRGSASHAPCAATI